MTTVRACHVYTSMAMLHVAGLALLISTSALRCVTALQPEYDGTPSQIHFPLAQGTSMATPHVAGLAALIRSAYSDASQPSPATVASAIMATAHKLSCPSGGSLNGATCST